MALTRFHSLIDTFSARPDGAAYTIARYRVLNRQVLVLYTTIGSNALGLAHTYYGAAPDWMIVACPAATRPPVGNAPVGSACCERASSDDKASATAAATRLLRMDAARFKTRLPPAARSASSCLCQMWPDPTSP